MTTARGEAQHKVAEWVQLQEPGLTFHYKQIAEELGLVPVTTSGIMTRMTRREPPLLHRGPFSGMYRIPDRPGGTAGNGTRPDSLKQDIRVALWDAGMGQKELARRTGMDPTALSKVLSGERRLRPQELDRIVNVLPAVKAQTGVVGDSESRNTPTGNRKMEVLGSLENGNVMLRDPDGNLWEAVRR